MSTPPYSPIRRAQSREVALRGGHYHLWHWAGESPATADRPLLVMAHGWMDVGAAFQFTVDAMDATRDIVAIDWRGFGHTRMPPCDSYWFSDYLADLDALLDALAPAGTRVDLLGHSMGGNVVMMYAGVRPERIRRLVNLEGFGMPATRAQDAPLRMRRWLNELKEPKALRDYDSADAVAERLRRNNPRLRADRALWLAAQWAEHDKGDASSSDMSGSSDSGRWRILADPAHKRVNPILSRRDEAMEVWREITAPLLWVEGRDTDMSKWWGSRYPRSDFDERLAVVKDVRKAVIDECGHMLHLDQPEALARIVDGFLG